MRVRYIVWKEVMMMRVKITELLLIYVAIIRWLMILHSLVVLLMYVEIVR
jgi:hypothetical protein